MFNPVAANWYKQARSSEDLVARATRHRKPRSSEGSLARAKNSMLQVCNPEVRSSDRMLARANNSNPQVCNQTHARATERSLERRTNQLARAKKISLEPRNTAIRSIPRCSRSLERRNPGSSDGPKTKSSLERLTARSSEGSKFWAATLCSQTLPTCNKPAQCIP